MPPKAPPPPAKLHIVMYKPLEGNYEHWALHLEHGPDNTIYEVVGEHPNFEKNSVSAKPQAIGNLKRSFQVGTINDIDLPNAKTEIRKVGVDNQTVHWNCQDYVLEIVDKLVEECYIEEDDYNKVKKAILRHFGPLI